MNRSSTQMVTLVSMITFVGCSPQEPPAPAPATKTKTMPVTRLESAGLPVISSKKGISDLLPLIGNTLTQAQLEQIEGSMALVPELQTKAGPTERNFLVRGDGDLVSLAVRTEGQRAIGMDFTLSASHDSASNRRAELLKTYHRSGQRTIKQLSPSLEVIEVPVTEYLHESRSNLHAATFEAGGVIRLVIYDATQVAFESMVPTVASVRPGVIEKARQIMEAQRAARKSSESK